MCIRDRSRDAVRELSVQYGCLHIEASAKLRLNIDSIFRCLLMKEAPPPRLSQQQDVRRRWPEEADTVKPTFLCVRNKLALTVTVTVMWCVRDVRVTVTVFVTVRCP